MNRHARILIPALAVVSAAGAFAQRADIMPFRAREQVLATATTLATSRDTAATAPLTGVANPFNPPAFRDKPDETQAAAPVVTRPGAVAPRALNERELLAAITPLVNPTGTVILGGEPFLLFGQRRLRVGDTLSVTFNNQPYDLVIADIQSISFTLRLGQEESTRPIRLGTRQ